MFITADNWSTANGRQTTVNRGYSTLCLYNYNLLSSVVRQLLTINWSTANGRQTTVNRGYGTLCLYNYNLLSSVNCQPLTNRNLLSSVDCQPLTINWSTANCQRSTARCGFSTLYLYNYNWRWTVVRKLLTKFNYGEIRYKIIRLSTSDLVRPINSFPS